MTTPTSPAGRAAGPGRHDPRSTWLTYESFYGLTEKPFSLSSDPRFFYHSASHTPAFDELLAGILRRESLCVLTGDIGMGKTTLCRAVIQSLDRKTFSAIVPDPFATREDLLKILLMDFGVMSIDDLTSGRLKGATRTELSYLLYEFLDTLAPLQAFAVVIIDEAQNLSVPLLEEIRILSDSDGRDRQLQVVLVGQLELRDKLMLPEMRQVDQRVSVRSTLEALNRDGVAGYIAHRLQVAGASPAGIWFTDEALDLIYQNSDGVPRLINRICDRVLYEGYLRRAPCIDDILVEAVISGAPRPEPDAAPAPVATSVPSSAKSDAPVRAEIDAAGSAPVDAPSAADFDAPQDLATIIEFAVHVDEDAAPANEEAPDEFSLDIEDDNQLVRDESLGDTPFQGNAPFLDDAPLLSDAPLGDDPLRPGPPPALEWARPGSIMFPREAAPTSAQRFRRRWTRRFAVAALVMMGLGAIGAGTVYYQNLSAELAAPTRVPRLPAAPPAPAMPAVLTAPAVPDADTADARQ